MQRALPPGRVAAAHLTTRPSCTRCPERARIACHATRGVKRNLDTEAVFRKFYKAAPVQGPVFKSCEAAYDHFSQVLAHARANPGKLCTACGAVWGSRMKLNDAELLPRVHLTRACTTPALRQHTRPLQDLIRPALIPRPTSPGPA
jgi:hypothetical protein